MCFYFERVSRLKTLNTLDANILILRIVLNTVYSYLSHKNPTKNFAKRCIIV